MRFRIRYVAEDTDRHGNVRIYYRRKGRKTRLPGPICECKINRLRLGEVVYLNQAISANSVNNLTMRSYDGH